MHIRSKSQIQNIWSIYTHDCCTLSKHALLFAVPVPHISQVANTTALPSSEKWPRIPRVPSTRWVHLFLPARLFEAIEGGGGQAVGAANCLLFPPLREAHRRKQSRCKNLGLKTFYVHLFCEPALGHASRESLSLFETAWGLINRVPPNVPHAVARIHQIINRHLTCPKRSLHDQIRQQHTGTKETDD